LSQHPLSRALAAQGGGSALPPGTWTGVQDIAGQGLQAAWAAPADAQASSRAGVVPADADPEGRLWRLGSAAWCGVPASEADVGRPSVFLAVQGSEGAHGSADSADSAAQSEAAFIPVARFTFDESLRADASVALEQLRVQGLAVQLWSGDQPRAVHRVAERLGIEAAHGSATPDDKLAAVERLQAEGRRVVMVGDGINDAPVLARADVSVAMGHAAALAQSRADLVMLGNRLEEIPAARVLARRTVGIVRQNLWWALAYNAACVPLALAGWLPPWLAGLGMALSSLLVVLNATRLTVDWRRGGSAAVPAAT
jgi:Cu2+-exporting ATPase